MATGTSALAGFAQGFAQSYNQQKQQQLEAELESRHNLAGIYASALPNMRPEAQMEALQRMASIYTTPIHKKLDKNLTDIGSLANPPASYQQMAQGAGQPLSSLPTFNPTTEVSTGELASTAKVPAPPPYTPFYSPEEKSQMAASATGAQTNAQIQAELQAREEAGKRLGLSGQQLQYFVENKVPPLARYQAKMIVNPADPSQPVYVGFNPQTNSYYDPQTQEPISNAIPWVNAVNAPSSTTGKVNPVVQAETGPPPNPKDYKGGTKDPAYLSAAQEWGKRAEEVTNRMAAASGAARGQAYNLTRPVAAINPETGEVQYMAAGQAFSSGAAPAGAGATAMSKAAQFGEMKTASQSARSAIQSLDRDFTPDQIAKLTLAMSHRDPGVMSNEIQTLLGTQQLTPAQQDFVVWVTQLQERALSLRNVAGMGAGSDQLRNAILATLPGVKSGNKQMALKQLDAFDNQVALLERGVPKVRGQGGVTPPPKPGASSNANAVGVHGTPVGTVRKGYRFLGGDESRQESWQKVGGS
jgi:hypothetical protein